MGSEKNSYTPDYKRIGSAAHSANFPANIPRSAVREDFEYAMIDMREDSPLYIDLKDKDTLDVFPAIEESLKDQDFYKQLDNNEKAKLKSHLYDLIYAGKGIDKFVGGERMNAYDRVQLTRMLLKAILNSTYLDPMENTAVEESLEKAEQTFGLFEVEGSIPEELYAKSAIMDTGDAWQTAFIRRLHEQINVMDDASYNETGYGIQMKFLQRIGKVLDIYEPEAMSGIAATISMKARRIFEGLDPSLSTSEELKEMVRKLYVFFTNIAEYDLLPKDEKIRQLTVQEPIEVLLSKLVTFVQLGEEEGNEKYISLPQYKKFLVEFEKIGATDRNLIRKPFHVDQIIKKLVDYYNNVQPEKLPPHVINPIQREFSEEKFFAILQEVIQSGFVTRGELITEQSAVATSVGRLQNRYGKRLHKEMSLSHGEETTVLKEFLDELSSLREKGLLGVPARNKNGNLIIHNSLHWLLDIFRELLQYTSERIATKDARAEALGNGEVNGYFPLFERVRNEMSQLGLGNMMAQGTLEQEVTKCIDGTFTRLLKNYSLEKKSDTQAAEQTLSAMKELYAAWFQNRSIVDESYVFEMWIHELKNGVSQEKNTDILQDFAGMISYTICTEISRALSKCIKNYKIEGQQKFELSLAELEKSYNEINLTIHSLETIGFSVRKHLPLLFTSAEVIKFALKPLTELEKIPFEKRNASSGLSDVDISIIHMMALLEKCDFLDMYTMAESVLHEHDPAAVAAILSLPIEKNEKGILELHFDATQIEKMAHLAACTDARTRRISPAMVINTLRVYFQTNHIQVSEQELHAIDLQNVLKEYFGLYTRRESAFGKVYDIFHPEPVIALIPVPAQGLEKYTRRILEGSESTIYNGIVARTSRQMETGKPVTVKRRKESVDKVRSKK